MSSTVDGSDEASIASLASLENLMNERLEKRKLRNRLAQRTFRRRQAVSRRKQQLGADLNQPCNEMVNALQEENASLRNSLIDIQSRLASLTASMSSLSVKVSKELGESVPEEPSNVDVSNREYAYMGSALGNKLDPKEFHSVHPSNVPYVTAPDDSSYSSLVPYTQACPPTLSMLKSDILSEPSMEARITSLTGQIPNIWTFDYQMGNKTYLRALLAKANSQNTAGWTWTESNSPISDHIDALLNLLKRKVENMAPFSTITLNIFYHKILMVLSMFNNLVQPNSLRWSSKTRNYQLAELAVWQIYPCTRTYNAIHPNFVPTQLQCRSQYPRVIDWVPFASLRDDLIRLHSANPQFDRILFDFARSYVVEALLSDLVKGAPEVQVYIQLEDLVSSWLNNNPSDTSIQHAQGVSLPAPDVGTLFSSPEYSRAACVHLNLDEGFTSLKVDPGFFVRHPELYNHTAKIIAEGIPMRPDTPRCGTHQPHIHRLNRQTLQMFQSFIDLALDYGPC